MEVEVFRIGSLTTRHLHFRFRLLQIPNFVLFTQTTGVVFGRMLPSLLLSVFGRDNTCTSPHSFALVKGIPVPVPLGTLSLSVEPVDLRLADLRERSPLQGRTSVLLTVQLDRH